MRPSGSEIEVNDTEANREYAHINDWVLVEPKPKKKPVEKQYKGDLLDSIKE